MRKRTDARTAVVIAIAIGVAVLATAAALYLEPRRSREAPKTDSERELERRLAVHTPVQGRSAEFPLPVEEIERRLHAFLEEYPDTRAAERLRSLRVQPEELWAQWRAILAFGSARSAEEALPMAVEALIGALRVDDAAARRAAAMALGELGPEAAEAATALQEAAEDAEQAVRVAAQEAIRRIGV